MTMADLELMLARCDVYTPTGARNRSLVLLMARGGWGAAQIIKLDVSDLSLAHRQVTVQGLTNSSPSGDFYQRVVTLAGVPLDTVAAASLWRWIQRRRELAVEEGPLFCTISTGQATGMGTGGQLQPGCPLARSYVAKMVGKLAEDAGLGWATPTEVAAIDVLDRYTAGGKDDREETALASWVLMGRPTLEGSRPERQRRGDAAYTVLGPSGETVDCRANMDKAGILVDLNALVEALGGTTSDREVSINGCTFSVERVRPRFGQGQIAWIDLPILAEAMGYAVELDHAQQIARISVSDRPLDLASVPVLEPVRLPIVKPRPEPRPLTVIGPDGEEIRCDAIEETDEWWDRHLTCRILPLARALGGTVDINSSQEITVDGTPVARPPEGSAEVGHETRGDLYRILSAAGHEHLRNGNTLTLRVSPYRYEGNIPLVLTVQRIDRGNIESAIGCHDQARVESVARQFDARYVGLLRAKLEQEAPDLEIEIVVGDDNDVAGGPSEAYRRGVHDVIVWWQIWFFDEIMYSIGYDLKGPKYWANERRRRKRQEQQHEANRRQGMELHYAARRRDEEQWRSEGIPPDEWPKMINYDDL